MSRLPLVNVGVIGLAADWQDRYLQAIEKMSRRLRVVAIHDDVAIRTRTTAERLQTQAVLGIRDLLQKDLSDDVPSSLQTTNGTFY